MTRLLWVICHALIGLVAGVIVGVVRWIWEG